MKYSEIAKMYCLSEKSVRRIVLNEKKKMEQKQVNVQQVMTKYGIEGDIKQIYSTAWNIGDEFVLKKYVNFEELKRNVFLIQLSISPNKLLFQHLIFPSHSSNARCNLAIISPILKNISL